MNVQIGDLNVDIELAHEFRHVITYIEAEYSRKSKEIGVDYPPNYIFDEDQSVKWNRERVQSENTRKRAERDKLRLERIDNYEKLYAYIKSYVEDYLGTPSLSDTFMRAFREYLKNHFDGDWPACIDGLLEVFTIFKDEISK